MSDFDKDQYLDFAELQELRSAMSPKEFLKYCYPKVRPLNHMLYKRKWERVKSSGFTIVPNVILDQFQPLLEREQPGSTLTLINILRKTNGNENSPRRFTSWISQSSLRFLMNFGRDKVIRSLRLLEQLGLMIVFPIRSGRRHLRLIPETPLIYFAKNNDEEVLGDKTEKFTHEELVTRIIKIRRIFGFNNSHTFFQYPLPPKSAEPQPKKSRHSEHSREDSKTVDHDFSISNDQDDEEYN